MLTHLFESKLVWLTALYLVLFGVYTHIPVHEIGARQGLSLLLLANLLGVAGLTLHRVWR